MRIEGAKKEIEALGISTAIVEGKGGELEIEIPLDKLVLLAQKLYGLGYNHLSSFSAVDYPEEDRFDLFYHVVSYETGQTIEIKTAVSPRGDEGNLPKVPSVYSIYPQVNWHEREHYDLLGIEFEGHPDMRRILLPDEWGVDDGEPLYPLRRDVEQKSWRLISRKIPKEGFDEAKKISEKKSKKK